MKLSKTIKVLVLGMAMVLLFAGCDKGKTEETDETTKETTVETTKDTEDEDEDEDEDFDEDYDDEEYADEDYDFDMEAYAEELRQELPSQDIEIDENYLKFYDYDKYIEYMTSNDFEYQEPKLNPDDISDETLKNMAIELEGKGYFVESAEQSAEYMSGKGIDDVDSGWGIAYLYNGFNAWYYDDNTGDYDDVAAYIVSPEIIEKYLDLEVKSEDGDIITYKEKGNKMCPFDGDITYDTTTSILMYHQEGHAVG